MADLNQQRFILATDEIIEQLRNGAKNVNTSKSTTFWYSVWKTWCEDKSIVLKMEEHEPAELNRLLVKFYAEVKNKSGDDYEPDSLKVMIAALDRHLKEKFYPLSIVKDREFHSSKQVLEGKAKLLRLAGRGKRPNKARNLTKEEEEVLWKDNKFGDETPEALTSTMWWLLTQHFGLRGRQEHHDMKIEDFQLSKDDNGVEFLQFAEGITKTRQGGLHFKNRDFQPRMFAVGGDRCPVAIFKQFVNHRPPTLKKAGSFYLSIKTNRKPDDSVWFKVQPMGVNKINEMMKNLVADTVLGSSEKKFTNHSARKTVVSKLKKAKVDRSGIMKITGHKNIQSVDDYDEADEDEQRELSYAISARNNNPQMKIPVSREIHAHGQQLQAPHCSSNPAPFLQPLSARMPLQEIPMASSSTFALNQSSMTASLNPTMMRTEGQNLLNTFNNCKVAFNFCKSRKSKSSRPRGGSAKRRRYHIESDSDTD